MKKLILLAGDGYLPKLIIKKCKDLKIPIEVLYLSNEKYLKNMSNSKKVSFGTILTQLKSLKKKILMKF